MLNAKRSASKTPKRFKIDKTILQQKKKCSPEEKERLRKRTNKTMNEWMNEWSNRWMNAWNCTNRKEQANTPPQAHTHTHTHTHTQTLIRDYRILCFYSWLTTSRDTIITHTTLSRSVILSFTKLHIYIYTNGSLISYTYNAHTHTHTHTQRCIEDRNANTDTHIQMHMYMRAHTHLHT